MVEGTECGVVSLLQLRVMSDLTDATLSCMQYLSTKHLYLLLNKKGATVNEQLSILFWLYVSCCLPGGHCKHVETAYCSMFFTLLFFTLCCFPTHMSPSLTAHVSDHPWATKTMELWMTGLQVREACWCEFWDMVKGWTVHKEWHSQIPKGGREAPVHVKGDVALDGCRDSDSIHNTPLHQHPHQCRAQPSSGPHRP